ncbi:unnamed protein product [Arabis nemorensis]|uniref:C2H2-type domain-containing protein n=1 Tax=Arabis nemorensis TaxID=586526 RepID=A0A565C153_9BRAS|nr:unnamed protein product [Arabis nemorensis]
MLRSPIGVWWDINTCPVPDGIDVDSVHSHIQRQLRRHFILTELSIFCVGNLERIPRRVLEEISSSGILLRHVPLFGWSALCDHMREWKKRYPSARFIMLISGDISWFTGSWFNSSIHSLGYCILRAFPAPRPPGYPAYDEWVWEELLVLGKNGFMPITPIPPKREHVSFCTLCGFPSQSVDVFYKHLQSREHTCELVQSVLAFVDENNNISHFLKLSDYPDFCPGLDLTIPWTGGDLSQNMSCLSHLSFYLRLFNQRSKISRVFHKTPTGVWRDINTSPIPDGSDPSFVGSRIESAPTTGVWWDINTCPIPDGYDPGLVRWRIESALQGYLGPGCPVTIFCIGNLEFISPQVLKEISSSGILLIHAVSGWEAVLTLWHEWKRRNPPPAKILLISADRSWINSFCFSLGYTILRALPNPQSFPPCTSTHAWDWASLLEEKSCLVDTITNSSCIRLTQSENSSLLKDEPASWYCTLCEIPSQSCDDFFNHLETTSHSQKLWSMVPLNKFRNKPRFLCTICNYPGYDHLNFDIHLTSEKHAQKVKEKKKMEVASCHEQEEEDLVLAFVDENNDPSMCSKLFDYPGSDECNMTIP